MPSLAEDGKSTLKTKLRNTCEKYSNIKIPDKQEDIIKKLTKNEQILVMKQDKGRGVVIMDKNKYVEKCLSFLRTTQFKKLTADPTCSTERQVQNLLRKVKKHLPEKTYKKLQDNFMVLLKFIN